MAKVSTAQSSYQGATINETIVPMYGGTLTWAPPGWGATGFSVIGFFGTGSDSSYERTHVASNLDGNREIDRLDIQALVQMPLGSHGTWSTGLRYVNFYSHAKGADAYTGRRIKRTTSRVRGVLAPRIVGPRACVEGPRIPPDCDGDHSTGRCRMRNLVSRE